MESKPKFMPNPQLRLAGTSNQIGLDNKSDETSTAVIINGAFVLNGEK